MHGLVLPATAGRCNPPRQRSRCTNSRVKNGPDRLGAPQQRPPTALLNKFRNHRGSLTGTRSTDSALEVRVIRMLRANGYPEPVRQEVLDDQDRFAGRVDIAYPERRLVIEVQSHRWHDGREPMDLDSARHNRHHAMGWVVMKATSKMLSGSARATFLQDLSRVYHRQL